MVTKAKNKIHKYWMNQVDDKNLGDVIREHYRKKLVQAGYKEYDREQSADGESGKES